MLAYRFLFSQLVRRELRQKYKGSALGVLWYLVNPLVMMGAYTLMFGVVFRLQRIPDYPLFLMVGLSVWSFFQASLFSSILAGASRSAQRIYFRIWRSTECEWTYCRSCP